MTGAAGRGYGAAVKDATLDVGVEALAIRVEILLVGSVVVAATVPDVDIEVLATCVRMLAESLGKLPNIEALWLAASACESSAIEYH